MAAIKELVHTEGDSNTTAARGRWDAGQDDPRIRGLLDRDASAFMH